MKQSSLIQDGSTTPPAFAPLTYKSFSPFQFSANDIKNIINKLDPGKAHGHNIITIHMIKLCDKNYDIFSAEWKKINVVPVLKKGDHHYVKTGRLVSFLSEFNNMF